MGFETRFITTQGPFLLKNRKRPPQYLLDLLRERVDERLEEYKDH